MPKKLFQPGQSGNPGGKPVGARNALSAKVLRDILDDWRDHGIEAIQAVRAADPSTYLRVVASLVPKEFTAEVQHRHVVELTDAELIAIVRGEGIAESESGEDESPPVRDLH